MSARVWFWLLSLSVLWGGSFFFAKVALAELAPLTVVFCRVALAALALNLVLVAAGRPLFRAGAPIRSCAVTGILNNLAPFDLTFWGGVAVLPGADAVGSDRGIAGQIACLGAALSYAIAGVYGRRFGRMGVAPLDAAAGQVTASALLILPIMLVVEQPWMLPAALGATTAAALGGLALLSTALGYILYFRILAAAGATNLLLVTFLIPVTAILLGALVLGERLAPRHFIGMLLIGLQSP